MKYLRSLLISLFVLLISSFATSQTIVSGGGDIGAQINAAEAAMSTQYCFTNVKSDVVDRVVQEYAGKAELGVNSFTVWHRNYDNAFYDLFMNGGRFSVPPLL